MSSSYRPSKVTFPLFLRFLEILPRLCSSTPLLPTLPLVSPEVPHVPLRLSRWPLGYEERICLVLSVQLVSKIFSLCAPDPPTSRTNGQTTCNRNTALCTTVHRAVKTHFLVSCFQRAERGCSSSGTRNENEIDHSSDSNVS